MTQRAVTHLATVFFLCAVASSAYAHHSHTIFYDQCKSITIEGRIDSVQWKDPHTLIVVKLDDGSTYNVDWAGLRGLTRNGTMITAKDALIVGARVTVTGNPIRTLAQIREHFPDLTSDVNPRTIDLRLIRVLGSSLSWARSPDARPPNCDGK